MASQPAQNYENHPKFPTSFVIGASLLLVALVIFVVAAALSGGSATALLGALGGILATLGALIALGNGRVYALVLQDRVIRLEMEVRMARVLPADLNERARGLGIKQRVALRFASDAELPALVAKVLDENLTDMKAIKRLVKDWQADHQRV